MQSKSITFIMQELSLSRARAFLMLLCLSDGKQMPQRWKTNASAMENKCLSDGNKLPSLRHNRKK